MNNLFPVFDVPGETTDPMDETQQLYQPAPQWDFAAGDFVFNGANQPVYSSGVEAWKLWCIKTIMTQRWAHFGYSENAGIESWEAFQETDRQAQESAFERTITEALLADPAGRTQSVQDFVFEWSVDSLRLTCEIVGHDGNSAEISVDITRGGAA